MEDKVQRCRGLLGQVGAAQEAPVSWLVGSRIAARTGWELVSGKGIQVVGLLDDIYREPELNRMRVAAGAARARRPFMTRGTLDKAGGKARAADVPNQDQRLES